MRSNARARLKEKIWGPATFGARLVKYPGKGGWTFVVVPKKHAPPVTRGWGRTPVRATLDGYSWDTSVWRDKAGQSMLPVTKKARGARAHGDMVNVTIIERDGP